MPLWILAGAILGLLALIATLYAVHKTRPALLKIKLTLTRWVTAELEIRRD